MIKLQTLAPKLLSSVFSFVIFVATPNAFAESTWRVGGGLGFGGAGISKQVKNEDGDTVVAEKGESPGTAHIFLEKLTSEKWVLSFEHARGYRLGPFSSGVGFTSGGLLWHYLGPAPDVSDNKGDDSFFVKRWSPYTGGSTGIAEGEIRREADKVPRIYSSGVFIGLRNGVDYLLKPDMGLRIEASYMFTFFQAAQAPANMSLFSLWAGVFIPAF